MMDLNRRFDPQEVQEGASLFLTRFKGETDIPPQILQVKRKTSS